jgi:hypothetical protein
MPRRATAQEETVDERGGRLGGAAAWISVVVLPGPSGAIPADDNNAAASRAAWNRSRSLQRQASDGARAHPAAWPRLALLEWLDGDLELGDAGVPPRFRARTSDDSAPEATKHERS